MAVRAAIAVLCLLPPTMLMGATLPAIARWVEASPRGIAWLGFFYGGNIAGAVIGSLPAGFYLLRLYDVAIGTYVAVIVNVAASPRSPSLVGEAQPTFQAPDDAGADARCPCERGAAWVYWRLRSRGSPRSRRRLCGPACCRCSSAAPSTPFR